MIVTRTEEQTRKEAYRWCAAAIAYYARQADKLDTDVDAAVSKIRFAMLTAGQVPLLETEE